jgi:hypothetical protein
MKLLTALFSLLDRLFTMWRDNSLREQGRQQAHKEAADESKRQVELAEYAATADDPDRTERLRSRFDDAARD